MVKKEGCWVRRGVIATCCVKGPLHLKATAASRGASTGGSAWLGSGFSELWWRRPLEAALGITPPLLELDSTALLGCQQVPRTKCERAASKASVHCALRLRLHDFLLTFPEEGLSSFRDAETTPSSGT